MKRTSSSSCQCSAAELREHRVEARRVRLDVDDVGRDVAALRLELVDLVARRPRESRRRSRLGEPAVRRRPALVVDAARGEIGADLGRVLASVRFSSGISHERHDGSSLRRGRSSRTGTRESRRAARRRRACCPTCTARGAAAGTRARRGARSSVVADAPASRGMS